MNRHDSLRLNWVIVSIFNGKKKAEEELTSPNRLFIFRPVCEISILVFSASIVVVSDLGFEILALTCTSES
jgi:hypothetical protein